MRIGPRRLLSIVMLLSVVVSSGCTVRIGTRSSRRSSPTPTRYPTGSVSGFDSRIGAAKSIIDFTTRDDALSAIAVDAARACAIDPTLEALSLMTDFTKRDATAEKSADIFLGIHRVDEARRISGQVTNFVKRDRILGKIARTPAGGPTEE